MGRSSTWEILAKKKAGQGRSWPRRLGCLALLLLVGAPMLLGLVAEVYFRHVPYAIHQDDALPPQQGPTDRGLWIRYLGVSGYEISDGTTTILIDPVATRPRASELLFPLASDPLLEEAWCPKADFILINHPHHDHSLDTPAIARRTGAEVYGSTSTCNLAQSRGVDAAKTHPIAPGDELSLGGFTVTVGEAKHVPIFGMDPPFAGEVSPDAGALWFCQFGLDLTFSFHIRAADGTQVWFHPTILFESGSLKEKQADLLIYGINGVPLERERTHAILAESGASWVIPTHYDNFTQPLNAGLALFPGVDMDAFRSQVRSYNESADAPVRWSVLDYGQRLYLPPPADE